jgi:hypothetical protein
VLAALLILAPAATADSNDAAYFNGLTAHGITASRLGPAFGPTVAIQLGHAICIDLGTVWTPVAEGVKVHDMSVTRSLRPALLVGWRYGHGCAADALPRYTGAISTNRRSYPHWLSLARRLQIIRTAAHAGLGRLPLTN